MKKRTNWIKENAEALSLTLVGCAVVLVGFVMVYWLTHDYYTTAQIIKHLWPAHVIGLVLIVSSLLLLFYDTDDIF